MIKAVFIFLLSFLFLFNGCVEEGEPILPGLPNSNIIIITDPDSSSIYLNNSAIGKVTPDLLTDLTPGFYKIDLTKYAYYDTSIYYILNRNVIDTINIEMREDPAFWWTIYNISNSSIPTNQISEIEVDAENNIWMATGGFGLIKFDGNNFTVYNTLNSNIPSDFINDIYLDEGKVWIAADDGFAKFENAFWTAYTAVGLNLPGDDFTSIVKDKNDVYWIGSVNGGLIKFDGVSAVVYNYHNSGLPLNYVNTITVDDDNVKWIGTWGEGIATFDGINWKVYNSFNNGIISDYIAKIIIDKDGSKWIASGSVAAPGGLIKFNDISFVNYSPSINGLPGGIVTDIAFDNKNNLWITSNGGVSKFNGSKWTHYNKVNSGMPSNSAVSIAIDNNQDKWIGTQGLAKYIGGKR